MATKAKKKKINTGSVADPLMLGGRFLSAHVHVEGTKSYYTLRRWREEFYLYHAGKYVRQADDSVKQAVTLLLQAYSQEKKDEGISVVVSRNLVNNVIANVESLIHISEERTFNEFLDGKNRGRFLCMKNGLLNLENRQLISHTPAFFSVVQLPYEYDPDADCPKWKTFLDEIMLGREDYISLIQEFEGYTFRPDLYEQKFFLGHGSGGNGKQVVANITEELVGKENCSAVQLKRFSDKFALYNTIGKIVNISNESSQTIEAEGENVLKSFVAGDSQSFDRKYKTPIDTKPTAKIMIFTNEKPRFSDRTQGTWRRILLVPFDLVVEEKNQIKTLAEELKKELPGILNWALEGLDRLNKQGFTIPEGQKELMETYRRESDPSRAFLLETYCESTNGEYIRCGDAYLDYVNFCKDNGYHSMSEQNFGKQVRGIFPKMEKRRLGTYERVYAYFGITKQTTSNTSNETPF